MVFLYDIDKHRYCSPGPLPRQLTRQGPMPLGCAMILGPCISFSAFLYRPKEEIHSQVVRDHPHTSQLHHATAIFGTLGLLHKFC